LPRLVEVTTWRPGGDTGEEQAFDWTEYGGAAAKPD
jgi:hypothetical protein